VADALVANGERWLGEIGDDPGAGVLEAEPAPVLMIDADELDGALAAVADFADLKSPFLRRHSTGVASLAVAAAEAAACRMPRPPRSVEPRWSTTSGASASPAGSGIARVR
jgi:hypothetical protein